VGSGSSTSSSLHRGSVEVSRHSSRRCTAGAELAKVARGVVVVPFFVVAILLVLVVVAVLFVVFYLIRHW
jgi:hypothetical protein